MISCRPLFIPRAAFTLPAGRPHARHTHHPPATMSHKTDYQNRQCVLALNICNLLYDLRPSTHDEIAPKLEFWIDYMLDEQFTTIADLADRVSCVAWEDSGSHPDISRFLKEFRDAPHRSEQARSFVDELCHSVLQWFSIASSEDVWANWTEGLVSKRGGPGFMHSASFVGHLIECGLIRHGLVRRHILKPLTAHYYNESNLRKQAIRAHAIYNLFTTAGNTLLQGLLDPEEVQDCFKRLDTRVSFDEIGGMGQLDSAKLKVWCDSYSDGVYEPNLWNRNLGNTMISGYKEERKNQEILLPWRTLPFPSSLVISLLVTLASMIPHLPHRVSSRSHRCGVRSSPQIRRHSSIASSRQHPPPR